MDIKIFIFCLSLFAITTIESTIRAAAEPLVKFYALTPSQATAAGEIADAILADKPNQVESLFNKHFANDLTVSAYSNIADQKKIAESLVGTVISTILLDDPSRTSLNNKAGNRLFELLPPRLLILSQSFFEQLTPAGVSVLATYLSPAEISHLMQTSKEASRILKPILEERNLINYWTTGKFAEIMLKGHETLILALTFSHDGKMLASGAAGGKIIIWDTKTGQLLKELIGHTRAVTSLDFSPDDSIIVSGGLDGTIRLWAVKTGKESAQFLGINNRSNQAIFSHDGTLVAYISEEGDYQNCIVRNLKTGSQEIKYFTYPVQIAFSMDDTILAIYGLDYGIKRDQLAVRLWNFHDDSVEGFHFPTENRTQIRFGKAAFSYDLKYVAEGYYNFITVWSLEGDPTRAFSFPRDRYFKAITFSPDGYLLAQASRGFSIVTTKFKTVRQFSPNALGTAVSFSHDGKTIAGGFASGDIILAKPE